MAESTTQLFPGRTVRVHSIECVEVLMDIGFGVHIQRRVMIEGVHRAGVPTIGRRQDDAFHCMVILMGGKRLLVQTNEKSTDGPISARVFLDEKTFGGSDVLCVPFGRDEPKLEIGSLWKWIATRGYKDTDVKAILNGKPLN